MNPRGIICVIAAVEIAAIMFCLTVSSAKPHENVEIIARNDVPVVNYPEYLQLIQLGRAEVSICGERISLDRDDFTNKEIGDLGLVLRAE